MLYYVLSVIAMDQRIVLASLHSLFVGNYKILGCHLISSFKMFEQQISDKYAFNE